MQNRIGSVPVSVLVPSVLYRGLEAQSGQTKTIKLVFVASPLSMRIKEKDQRLVGSESG